MARHHLLVMSTPALQHAPAPGIGRIAMRLIWFTYRFASRGPLVGYLVLWSFFSIVMFPWTAASLGFERALSSAAISLFGFFLLIIPVFVAYAMTLVPAAFTGFVAGILSYVSPQPQIYYPLVAATGFASTHLYMSQAPNWPSDPFGFPLIGAAAGLICAWSARRRMDRHPKLYGIPVTL